MNIPPIAALEIGSSRTVVLVGEADSGGRITVVGKGVNVSKGVRKGQIVDLDHAALGVTQAVRQAVDESRIDVGRVILAASGGYIAAEVNQGSAPVRSRDHVVSAEDVEDVFENAQSMSLPQSDGVMHTIPQDYRLDGQPGIAKPVGLKGVNLSLSMLIIHAQTGSIENLRNVASAASLDVDDVAFSPLCAALAVLSPQQKKSGVAVVDLGGGTTSYVTYVDGIIASAGSYGIGGDHVTNDLALAFNIPQSRAEDLKCEYGSALVGGGGERIPIPADFSVRDRTISLKALRTVINARMDETLKILRARFVEEDVMHKLGAGVVFTGGGASLHGLVELAQSVFGVPCLVGSPRNVLGLENADAPHSFAVAAGLLLYGLKTWQSENRRPFDSLRRLLGL